MTIGTQIVDIHHHGIVICLAEFLLRFHHAILVFTALWPSTKFENGNRNVRWGLPLTGVGIGEFLSYVSHERRQMLDIAHASIVAIEMRHTIALALMPDEGLPFPFCRMYRLIQGIPVDSIWWHPMANQLRVTRRNLGYCKRRFPSQVM
jgi:hypothetical protein